MSSRQQQQQQNTTQTNRQNFQKNYTSNSTPQGPPPPYPSPGDVNAVKRLKTESGDKPATPTTQPPSFYLTPQQIQILSAFQQNINTLTPPQQQLMQQLQHQYRLMQQHQQQTRNQRQTQNQTPVTRSGSTPPQFPNQNNSNSTKSYSPPSNNDKLVQPQPVVVPSCAREPFLQPSGQHSTDIDISEEEIKDLLSQKDLATTLAEDLLKHFGSDDLDVKESPPATGKLIRIVRIVISVLAQVDLARIILNLLHTLT